MLEKDGLLFQKWIQKVCYCWKNSLSGKFIKWKVEIEIRMVTNIDIVDQKEIENRIFTFRGLQVMLDSHLAELYQVETKVLNQAVKRNMKRFPPEFMFKLNEEEWDFLRSQIVTFKSEHDLKSHSVTKEDSRGKHTKYLPYVFTEQGVAMLSAVLRSEIAVKVSIQIINAFVNMRKMIAENIYIDKRFEKLEKWQLDANGKFEQIFKALEHDNIKKEKGIFFDGQVFNAYHFVSDLIRSATKSIVLIDNYIDDMYKATKKNRWLLN